MGRYKLKKSFPVQHNYKSQYVDDHQKILETLKIALKHAGITLTLHFVEK